MKFLKFVLFTFALAFLASCSVEDSAISDTPDNQTVEVDQRSSQAALVAQLNIFTTVMQGQSNGTQNNQGAWAAWNNLGDVIQGCGVDVFEQSSFYLDNGWSCDKIGVDMVDAQAGLGCPDVIAIAYAQADCYMRQYVTSGGQDDLAYGNFQNAYCHMLTLLNLCLEVGINADAYCRLLDR